MSPTKEDIYGIVMEDKKQRYQLQVGDPLSIRPRASSIVHAFFDLFGCEVVREGRLENRNSTNRMRFFGIV